VVIGASSGLGFAITCHLLKHNAAKIITLSNKEENAIKAIELLKSWGDTSKLVWHRRNLKDLSQVDHMARKLRVGEKRIDAVSDSGDQQSPIMTLFSSFSTPALASINTK
jgi:WW domain-containing oxidoreductase